MNPFLNRLSMELPFIHDDFLARMLAFDTSQIEAAEHPGLKKLKESFRPQAAVDGSVAIVPIAGALMQNPDPWEMAMGYVEDVGALTSLVQEVTNSTRFSAIVLNLDTPGGMVTGGMELADAVTAAARIKPVVAWTGSMAASMGYLIGSQAGTFVSTRSAQVGSIGTVYTVMDMSAMLEKLGIKTHTFTNKEGDLKRLTPMNDARSAHIQERVDGAFAEFKRMVKAKRPGVPDSAMRGQAFFGSEALANGMVDIIGSLQSAIELAKRLGG